jgi:phage-related minor tail protein
MSDDYGFDDLEAGLMPLPEGMEKTRRKTGELEVIVQRFSSAMTRAFGQAVTGGKQFDDVLKNVALSLSKLAVQSALKPLGKIFSGGFKDDEGGAMTITPFASGGVIGAPSYFPMAGGLGLAGEAGPEAIMPLSRGPDGRLGIAGGAPSTASITVQITTPDADSFRRSEAYVTGQIARAVARGQRGL